MALTIGEASAYNLLLDYFLGSQSGLPVYSEDAKNAAVLLADHAHKSLSAGWTGDQVTERWPKRRKNGNGKKAGKPSRS